MAWVQEIYEKLFDPDTVCVACISYGKDSLAMLRAIKLLGLPLHRIITTDVWATQDIPADLPPMWEWKKEAARIIEELYGVKVEHICAMQNGSQISNVERERKTEGAFGSATNQCSTKISLNVANLPEPLKDSHYKSGHGAKTQIRES